MASDDALPIYPLSRRSWLLLVVLAVVLCVTAMCLFYRFHYGIWPGAKYPSALHYCGNTYNQDQPANPRSAADSLASEIARPAEYSGSTLSPAFEYTAPFAHSYHVFAGRPKSVHVGDTPTCSMKLYLQTSANHYLGYHLHGSAG